MLTIKKVRLKGTDAGEESVIDSFQSHKVRLKDIQEVERLIEESRFNSIRYD